MNGTELWNLDHLSHTYHCYLVQVISHLKQCKEFPVFNLFLSLPSFKQLTELIKTQVSYPIDSRFKTSGLLTTKEQSLFLNKAHRSFNLSILLCLISLCFWTLATLNLLLLLEVPPFQTSCLRIHRSACQEWPSLIHLENTCQIHLT